VLKHHGDSQTIVISPLSLSVIPPGEGVRKIQLKEIDRNQRSLSFADTQEGRGASAAGS
jgi:hypothetical protein